MPSPRPTAPYWLPFFAVCLLVTGACGDDDDDTARADASRAVSRDAAPLPDAAIPDATPSDQQLIRGSALFATNCARCHGADGLGTALGPAVIGPDTLPLNPPPGRVIRTGQFRTALDVFEFVRANMPFDNPGSLPDETYLDVLAFILDANSIVLDEPLTVENAESIVINP